MSDTNTSTPVLLINNTPICYLEQLRENFYIEDVIARFKDGSLLKWLRDKGYDHEADKVEELEYDQENLALFLRELLYCFDIDPGNTNLNLLADNLNYVRREAPSNPIGLANWLSRLSDDTFGVFTGGPFDCALNCYAMLDTRIEYYNTEYDCDQFNEVARLLIRGDDKKNMGYAPISQFTGVLVDKMIGNTSYLLPHLMCYPEFFEEMMKQCPSIWLVNESPLPYTKSNMDNALAIFLDRLCRCVEELADEMDGGTYECQPFKKLINVFPKGAKYLICVPADNLCFVDVFSADGGAPLQNQYRLFLTDGFSYMAIARTYVKYIVIK